MVLTANIATFSAKTPKIDLLYYHKSGYDAEAKSCPCQRNLRLPVKLNSPGNPYNLATNQDTSKYCRLVDQSNPTACREYRSEYDRSALCDKDCYEDGKKCNVSIGVQGPLWQGRGG